MRTVVCSGIFFLLSVLSIGADAKPAGDVVHRLTYCPEQDLSAPEIISFWGYPSETHAVTTGDGYVLQMHRIPYGRESPKTNTTRPVILMLHGLEESSADFLINLPQQSAGFIFADEGFDVWLGNVRGNTYGKEHTRYSPSDRAFWRFSWDDMVTYDLDAMFDHVQAVTGQEQIYYVGHSQGTLVMFAKLSEQPEFSSRIKRAFMLAPVATVKTIKGLLVYIADYIYPYFSWIFDILGDGQFLPSNWVMSLISDYVCDHGGLEEVCSSIIFLIAGPEVDGLNQTRMGVITAHAPAGTSTENILHWTQMVISGRMQKYDFGSAKDNRQHYGQTVPPDYDLSRIQGAKLHLYSSKADTLADPSDIEHFLIPNIQPKNIVEHVILEDFSHVDFVWALEANALVYQPIIDTIKELDNVP
ncbi:Hydrolase, alpha/beta domain protein [Aphelenchoides fujianensis]|nr:Hydrolase, alpha/beta domain protein [Aphelenchoides fujianensis]